MLDCKAQQITSLTVLWPDLQKSKEFSQSFYKSNTVPLSQCLDNSRWLWSTVQLTVCVGAAATFRGVALIMSSGQFQRPRSTSRQRLLQSCVPLWYRPICQLQRYSQWVSIFWWTCEINKELLLYYTAITWSQYCNWYRGNYYRYRFHIDTIYIGWYTIPDAHQSQPSCVLVVDLKNMTEHTLKWFFS